MLKHFVLYCNSCLGPTLHKFCLPPVLVNVCTVEMDQKSQ